MRKEEIKQEVEKFLNSEKSVIEKATELKALERFIKDAKAKLSGLVLDELDKENNIELNGFKVYKTTSATTLSFDHNEDWSNRQSKITALQLEQKEIEDKMKLAYNKGITILNEDTGEVYEPAKYKSGGKETYAIK